MSHMRTKQILWESQWLVQSHTARKCKNLTWSEVFRFLILGFSFLLCIILTDKLRRKETLIKNCRKSFFLPDMAREKEETSALDTMVDETILEVVWVPEDKKHMCLIWRPLVILLTGLFWWSQLSYRQHHGNPNFLPGGDWFGGRIMSQFENRREPIVGSVFQ